MLEEALRLNIDPQVVLPTPLARFRAESVEPGWRDRFDAVIATAGHAEATPASDGEDRFAAGNDAILRAALARDDEVVALVIAAPGESEYTEDFARTAERSASPSPGSIATSIAPRVRGLLGLILAAATPNQAPLPAADDPFPRRPKRWPSPSRRPPAG